MNTDTDVLVRYAKTETGNIFKGFLKGCAECTEKGPVFFKIYPCGLCELCEIYLYQLLKDGAGIRLSLLWLFIKNTQQFLPGVQLNIMAVR